MAESHFDPSHGSGSHDDIPRNPVPGDPPMPGAQWDEVHRRWERWNDDAQEWEVVGDEAGDGVAPEAENPLPALLARELARDDDLEKARPADGDVARAAEPTEGPPGAQWNEITNRWERWDEATEAW